MNIQHSKDITEEEITRLHALSSLISSRVTHNLFERAETSLEFTAVLVFETLLSFNDNIIALRPKEATFNNVPVKTIFQTCFWTCISAVCLQSLQGYRTDIGQDTELFPFAVKSNEELFDEFHVLDSEDIVTNRGAIALLPIIDQIPRKKICEQLYLGQISSTAVKPS